ncbi:hypothetical protein LTR36_009397 [Oleoguttula mirabilis]|uniref:Uncharacterized protein n=1 Tax=Oleoguttula mirabilis TaxID=1507867 RepID=A0AAV9JS85_9PEZI|nr:hypothetical protein LTR36_009397 [Oleoguttula mirabilis]
MASGGHLMLQQRPSVETKLKQLLVPNLKEICKGYGQPSSGNKAPLQGRCMDILEDIIQRGDAAAFEDLRFRVNNQGRARPQYQADSPADSNSSPGGGYSQYTMPPAKGSALPAQNRLPPSGKYFKSSPFYEIVETVSPLQDLPGTADMPQNRHTAKTTIKLTPEQCQLIANEDMRLLMYCGLAQGMSLYHPVDIAFPNQVEVKINNDDLKANFKGLKNKPGSTKPADITTKFRTRPPGYDNQVTITYALTTKKYAFIIYLVRHIDAEELTGRIRQQNVIPIQKVLDEMNKANADPDIEATSTRMSLKDPISTVRISIPVRSTVCTHNQCFDGGMFLQMMEQAPLWNCPVCNKAVSFQSLCVDKYFENILKTTPKSIEKVDVEPNGEWRVIREEEDEQPNGASGKPRASYDDDFDDDLVEVPDPTNKPLNILKRESQPPALLFNTPPLSSREPSLAQSTVSVSRAGTKRPSGAVIDLTLSDDDEQPIRPSKRQHTSTSQNQGSAGSANSYHTPASIPDRNSYQPPQQQQQRHADYYRPSSNAGPSGSSSSNALPYLADGAGSESLSPLRATPAYQPPGGPPGGWAAQHSRPPSQTHNGVQPFSIRPPPSPGGAQGQLRLPPMQAHPPQPPQQQQPDPFAYGGWRSDRGNSYSNSPG